MSSSSDRDRLVSHPHQSLWRHLCSVDEVSGQALAGKCLPAGFFPGIGAKELRRYLVWFHDFGKATDFFQYRIARAAYNSNPNFDGLDAGHVRHFLALNDAEVERVSATVGDPLRGHSIVGAFTVQSALPEETTPLLRAIIWEAVARHHGNLKDFEPAVRRGSEDHVDTLCGQWERIHHREYLAILDEVGLACTDNVEGLITTYPRIFFGRVYRKLKKNRSLRPYLQAVFLFSLLLAGDKGDMMLRDRSVVGRGRRIPGKLVDRYKSLAFGQAKPTVLNEWREAAYRTVEANLHANPDAACYAITLPTGMGKTLTAYNAAFTLQNLMAEAYAKSGERCVPRILYCLPFTSVIDQNAAILENILAVADDDLSGELAKHHYLADWPDERAGQDQKLQFSEKEYLVEGWEYGLTVTTFVQLLETLVSHRNRTLRKFHNLANAIVILDEVQSIPPKYFDLVSKLFKALYENLGTRFVFVTATQPFLLNPADGIAPLELTDPNGTYTRKVFRRMNRIDLDVGLWINGPDELAELTDGFATAVRQESQRSFLFILNLVRESQRVFKALRGQREPGVTYLYLSSAILPILRKRIIGKIKEKRAGIRNVVVSTQVVEAGVDIDLDVVYRAFAPLDSINQSAGRCNRNMDPNKRGSVRLFKNEGARKIYDRVLLDKTRITLQHQLAVNTNQFNGGQNIIPEADFFEMNERYAGEIRKAVADHAEESEIILKDLYRLHFESASNAFNLIVKEYVTYGVFIDDPTNLPPFHHRIGDEERDWTSTEIHDEMLKILRNPDLGRWDKKQQLRLLRPALLQYVVQVPERFLPEDLREEAQHKPFIRCGTEGGAYDYSRFYDLTTGYFPLEDDPTSLSF